MARERLALYQMVDLLVLDERIITFEFLGVILDRVEYATAGVVETRTDVLIVLKTNQWRRSGSQSVALNRTRSHGDGSRSITSVQLSIGPLNGLRCSA